MSSLNPAMPKALDPVIAKLLAKDRDQRYRSAEELLAALEAVPSSDSSRPAVAVPAPPAEPLRPPEVDRRRSRNRIIAVSALLLVAAGAGAFLFRNRLGNTAVPGPSTEVAAPVGTLRASRQPQRTASSSPTSSTRPEIRYFDTTLNQALRVQLAQSPVLDIISQQHLRQSLSSLAASRTRPLPRKLPGKSANGKGSRRS